MTRSPGLILVGLAVLAASFVADLFGGLPLLVVSLLMGIVIANSELGTDETRPGLGFAATTLLRFGIVLLGLRLAVDDITGLGATTLGTIVVTVFGTFFGVQYLGRRLGLSANLSLLVASGFSICGNSAIASVNGVVEADDEEVAAAVGLVTLAGTAAIVVMPALGSLFGLTEADLGTWVGASVQDTAQVIAVGSTLGPGVLAIATAVKLTRVLLLAPIVGGVSLMRRRGAGQVGARRPSPLPVFVVGFLAMILLRSADVVPAAALEHARSIERYALAAGMVGLGSTVRFASLRRLGLRPLVLGGVAWLVVGGTSLGAIQAL